MKKFLILLIFVTGCVANKSDNEKKISDVNFSDDMSIEEFRIKLEVYSNDNPYPNIDN